MKMVIKIHGALKRKYIRLSLVFLCLSWSGVAFKGASSLATRKQAQTKNMATFCYV